MLCHIVIYYRNRMTGHCYCNNKLETNFLWNWTPIFKIIGISEFTNNYYSENIFRISYCDDGISYIIKWIWEG